MKNLFCGLGILALALSFSSCEQALCSINKKGFLNTFDSFLEKIEKEDLQSDDKRWEAYDQKFETMVNECYKNYEADMTDSEKQEFWAGTVKYYWERHGMGLVRRLGDKNDPLATEITENVREVWGGLDNVVNQMIDEFGDSMENVDMKELENLMDEMGGDVEKWGKKLEKIFEKIGDK